MNKNQHAQVETVAKFIDKSLFLHFYNTFSDPTVYFSHHVLSSFFCVYS